MKKTTLLYDKYLHFPIKGVNFIDLTPSLLNPKVTEEIIRNLMLLHVGNERKVKAKIDYIISPDARGFIWGGMVAKKYDLGFIPVRKIKRMPQEAIQSKIDYTTEYSSDCMCLPIVDIKGKKLLFIDDVYATGGTYNAVKEMVIKNNGILIGGSVPVDVELNSNNKEVKSLVKISELMK